MFTLEESALLGFMLRALKWATIVLALGGGCYVGAHWLHHRHSVPAAARPL